MKIVDHGNGLRSQILNEAEKRALGISEQGRIRMTSMIEKVAKAIYDDTANNSRSNGVILRWEENADSYKAIWRYRARAAIAAMRFPTAEMIEAGFTDHAFVTPDLVPPRQKYNPKAVYHAMIDAALGKSLYPHPPHDERTGNGDHPGDHTADDELD